MPIQIQPTRSKANTTMSDYLLSHLSASETTTLLLSLTSALVYLPLILQPTPTLPRTLFKTLSTALLALLVWEREQPLALTAALGLGSLGDLFLAHWDTDRGFLCGLGSFLVAHLWYVVVFLRDGGVGRGGARKVREVLRRRVSKGTVWEGMWSGVIWDEVRGDRFWGDVLTEAFWTDKWTALRSERWRVSLATGMLIVAPVMNLLLMPNVGANLKGPVMVYSLVILVMFLAVLTVEDGTVVIGALMFAASDVILSAEKFLLNKESAKDTDKNGSGMRGDEGVIKGAESDARRSKGKKGKKIERRTAKEEKEEERKRKLAAEFEEEELEVEGSVEVPERGWASVVMQYAVWVLYYAGQATIAVSFGRE